MNFNSLYNKLEIIEEARTSSVWLPGWQNMLINTRKFQTKLQQEEGLRFPTPINALAKYALATIDGVISGKIDADSSGAEIENELEDQVKQERNTGLPYTQLISKLKEITDPKLKEEINKVWTAAISADNPIEYWAMREINFSNRKLSDDQYKSQITNKRDHLKGLISQTFLGGNIEAVQKAKEEEKAAKKTTKGELESALGSLEKLETQNNVIIAVSLQGDPFEPEKMLGIITKMLKGYGGAPVDLQYSDEPPGIVITFDVNSKWSNVLDKKGISGTQQIITNAIANTTGLQSDEFDVSVGSPTTELMRSAAEKAKEQRAANQPRKKIDVDTQGLGIGTIAGDDSERRLANPFEDEEEPVTENAKPKIQFISNKDRFKPKTFWQKIAQQEMFYR